MRRAGPGRSRACERRAAAARRPGADTAPRTTHLTGRALLLAVVALALGGFGIGTTEFAIMGLLPLMVADLGVDIPAGGHVISAYALGVVVGAPLLSTLGARLPHKRALPASLAA